MSSAQITTGQDSIVTEIEVAAPPERVFAALTDPQQLMRWWRGEDHLQVKALGNGLSGRRPLAFRDC